MRKEPRALSPSSCSVCLGGGQAISRWPELLRQQERPWTWFRTPGGLALGCQTRCTNLPRLQPGPRPLAPPQQAPEPPARPPLSSGPAPSRWGCSGLRGPCPGPLRTVVRDVHCTRVPVRSLDTGQRAGPGQLRVIAKRCQGPAVWSGGPQTRCRPLTPSPDNARKAGSVHGPRGAPGLEKRICR